MQNIRKQCSVCAKLLINPIGNPASSFLLVGDFPGYVETIQGVPFAFRNVHNPRDSNKAGDVLKVELTRVGIMMNQVLITNLWQHQKDWKVETTIGAKGKEKKQKVEACPLAFHLDELVRLFEGKTHVLLMGSEVTEALLGIKTERVSGTQVRIAEFSKIHFWVSPNPSLVFNQPIGEWRLALKRFSEDVSKKKN